MALKTSFEDSSVIASPFVDEVANPGQGGTAGAVIKNRRETARALDSALSRKGPAPVTGEPATEVVNAASPEQLREQGSSDTTILARQRQITAAARKKSKE